MTESTALDLAHDAMMQAEGEDAARLRFFAQLSDAELLLLLEDEPQGDALTPQLFEVEEGQFVLAFDSEERLAAFAEATVPYAALSGRVLAEMLAGQGIGLGLNLGVAPSSMLIPAEAMGWLTETVAQTPDEASARLISAQPPRGLPERLLSALDAKLASAGALAQAAFLAEVTYAGGARGHLLGFVEAEDRVHSALAKAVSEALIFSGLEAGALDVGFFKADDPMTDRLMRAGMPIDLPKPAPQTTAAPVAPGMDPKKPPKLR